MGDVIGYVRGFAEESPNCSASLKSQRTNTSREEGFFEACSSLHFSAVERSRKGTTGRQTWARRAGILMEWRDLEVWRRQRSYVGAELRKDAPDHVARLGLATSFVFVAGMAEGARVSALKGDLKFPIRYAVYNVIPSFVGGKVPASSVAAAMASPPPLRACTRAAAHAANLRALRTAVAGYTVLSIVFQVALAGGKGTDAYQQAVAEGFEVPSMSTSDFSGSDGSAGGVVRLCGARGLEPALKAAVAGRGGYRTPILPVVISGVGSGPSGHTSSDGNLISRAASSLPAGALSAVVERSPRPCYHRIDHDRLFCREAWQPVAAEAAEVGVNSNDREIVLVLEADSLSSDVPQTLMSSPVKVAAVAGLCRGGGSGAGGGLGKDEAVWGLAMLRKVLEENRERDGGRVAGVLLAERRLIDVEGSTTVSINARAALLLSVLSWAQQCSAEFVAHGAGASSDGHIPSAGDETGASTAETTATMTPEDDTAGRAVARHVAEVEPAVVNTADGVDEELGADGEAVGENTSGAEEHATPPDGEPRVASANTAARILGGLEHIGRGVRVVIAPIGQLRSAIGRPLGVLSAWVKEKGRRVALPDAGVAANRVLFYDTDDNESFRWLAAQMLKTGWTVKRIGSEPLPKMPAAISDVPVLVHHCSDEKTLTAAAGHLSRDDNGPPVCAVVHGWDCGVEARRLLLGTRGGVSGVPAEVICTAEVGEDLFQFVRWQLLSGATTEQVQKGLDDLFAPFHEVGAVKI